MKPMYACSTRIDMQGIDSTIVHHFQDMRMPADKKCRRLVQECTTYRCIVMARITSDMFDQHIGPFDGKAVYFRVAQTDFTPVDIAAHSTEGPKSLKLVGHFERTYITGMPNLVTLGKVPGITFIPIAMGIREQADALHEKYKSRVKS